MAVDLDFENCIYPKRESFISKNRSALLSIFVFFIAMIIGTRAVALGYTEFYNKQIDLRCSQPFFYIFLNISIGRLIDCIVIFLSGFFVFGFITSTLWIGYIGLRVGLISGGLYLHGLSGFGCFALVFMPFLIAELLIFSLLNAKSCEFSIGLLKCATNGNRMDTPTEFKLYIMRFVVLFIALAVCVLLESADNCILISLFDLR